MKKFKNAFDGLRTALNHQAVLVQILLAVFAIIGGILIKLDIYEWLAFVICIGIASEIFNTAIEKIGDYLNNENDERIKVIKDLSSAAVLVSAVCAFVVCILCVIRRL